jgi:hypothetical protein
LDELRELAGSRPSTLSVPINGGIFAVVVMLMFASAGGARLTQDEGDPE